MANEEHLVILKRSIAANDGMAEWNQWRKEHPKVKPDFNEADLHGADLHEANLSEAALIVAALSEANLGGANLRWASLSGADLRGANLSGADLHGANLSDSDLSAADPSKAKARKADLRKEALQEGNIINARFINAISSVTNLRGSNLSGANLSGANLTEANLSETNLSGANLSGANLSETILSGAILSDNEEGGIELYEAKIEETNLSVIEWERLHTLGDELHGMKAKRKWQSFFVWIYLAWLNSYAEHKQAARAYQRLTKALRDQNLNDEADRYAYRAQICRRRMFFRKILAWPTKLPQYLLSHLMNLLAGYGYKPERTLFWYLVTVFGFMFMYLQVSQGWAPFGLTTPTSLSPHLQWYEALILSVSSFHGRGFFQPVQSLGDPVAALAAIEAVIGLFIEVSFIATFTQRFFGK